jgi:purine-nucleoside phosphorylase
LSELRQQIQAAADFIRSKAPLVPEIGIILGTGMGALAEEVTDKTVIDYGTIPHFPVSTVESHAGRLHVGKLEGRSVVMMQGRFHRYEGYSLQQVTFPIRVMKALGIKALVVMNAVGSVNSLIPVGSLVVVQDHINLMGDNPLIGPNDDDLGPRFPDMSQPYDREFIALAQQVAVEERLEKVTKGVLVAVTGPCLETAAEYRMFQIIGADLVTMSTIPEVIVSAHAGIRTVAISTVTDMCLPDALHPTSLADVIAAANGAQPRLSILVKGLVRRLPSA